MAALRLAMPPNAALTGELRQSPLRHAECVTPMSEEVRKPVVFLVGDRVYLRPLEFADLALAQRWINDPATRRGLTIHWPINEIAERKFIEKASESTDQVVLAIVLRDGDRPIGAVGLHFLRWKDRAGEVGIMIGEAQWRGHGYGPEALLVMLRYAFEELNLNRVQICVYDFNDNARRAYEKLGFVREGVQREYTFKEGHYVDQIVYSMLAREWFARQQ
ncbi:MAG TPA: GNAT family protein [Phycisphaerae bacterium]|nr:GNAT family protein [Phycisphaerae bacterium]HNU43824.1 GNAT family protein [Phycisphaerae bacterium]